MRAGIVLFLAAACAAQDVSSGGAEAPLAKWTQEVGEEFAERVVDLALRVTNMQVPFSVPRERVNLDVDATTDQTVELSGMTYGELARWKDVIEGHRAFWDQYLVETARLFDRSEAVDMFRKVAWSAQRQAGNGLARDWRAAAAATLREDHGDTTSFGGGAGFGFQIMCDSDVVFTMGGGLGAGAGGSLESEGTGGAGAGGGFQVPSAFGASTDTVNAGGGGGGAIVPVATFDGSNDDDAHGSFSQAREQVVQLVRACESRGGTPSLQGGGGGGHGFATGGGFAFGGGFGFSFRGSFREGSSSLDSLAVSPEGGATGQKVPGKAIGAAARACRKKCIPGAHTDGGQIYECYCHCTKTKFADLGLSWASKIECE